MSLKCFLCKATVLVTESRTHFAFVHDLEFLNGDCNFNFICANDNCVSSFKSYNSFRKHIINKHCTPEETHCHPGETNINLSESFVGGSNINEQIDFQPQSEGMEYDLNYHIKQFISQLRSNTSMTQTDFLFVIESLSSSCEIILKYFNIPVQDIINIKKAYHEAKTFKAQKKIQSETINSVEPIEINLGYRSEIKLKNGQSILKQVPENSSYIPIIKTLTNIISNKNLLNLIETEKLHQHPRNNIIESFTDTETYKNHPFLKKYPRTLRINLYYDGVEMVNSIGSKTGLHSVGLFYFTIQNFPMHFSTNLKNIYDVLVCNMNDIKKYGLNTILKPIIDDMKLLETDEGVEIQIDKNTFYTLRAILHIIIGDALSVSEMFGLLSPAANFFCRECMCSRNDLKNFTHTDRILRTKELHEDQIKSILDGSSRPNEFGIAQCSILNSLKYFHSTHNFSYDLMHDLWEGVLPMEIKYVLRYFIIEKKYFDITSLNKRINNFRWGPLESKNRPSANFTYPMLYKIKLKTIRQKAIQCWVLLRAFPFLFGHLIPVESNQYMELISLLSKIVQIVVSTQITEYMLCELDRCIKLHECLFHILFPSVSLINKHHHLTHYVNSIKTKGPMFLYSCIKYEAKHFLIKKKIMQCGNFKNVAKSIMSTQAYLQNDNIANQKYSDPNLLISRSKLVTIENCLSEIYIKNITDDITVEQIFILSINEIIYKKNLYIMINDISNESTYPVFRKILEIINIRGVGVFFFCSSYETVLLSETLNSFEIKHIPNDFSMISSKYIVGSVTVWQTYNENDKQYVCLKEHF